MSIDSIVFLDKPRVLYVDEDYSVKAPAHGTISLLMKSLQDNGPLVAQGNMGPDAYTSAPFKLKDKVNNKEIHGWKPNTFKEFMEDTTNVILLGARKIESKAYVYFTLAQDITKSNSSVIRGYKPLEADEKIYIMSYDNFLERGLTNLHPICPHAQWLFSVPVNSILDRGEVEKKCNQIGQQIFDHYKAATNDSEDAEAAVKRICEAARFLTADGHVRKAHIERAWDGIGDTTWRWQS